MKSNLYGSALLALLLFTLHPARGDTYTLNLVSGWNAVANQLAQPDQSLNALLPVMPDGTMVAFWNITTQAFVGYTYDSGFLGWVDQDFNPAGNVQWRPGVGALLFNPDVTNQTLSFNGAPNIPILPIPLPAGLYALVSRQTNGPATYDDIVGEPPVEGTLVFTFVPGCATPGALATCYLAHLYKDGAWSPSPPVASIGEAVFIQLGNPVCTTNLGPIITMHPSSQTVQAGESPSFVVTATGEPPLSYQWLFESQLLPAATNLTLVITNAQADNAGQYMAVVTNSYGSATSQVARLVVLPPGGIGALVSGVTTGSFCFTFTSLAGATYYLEYKNLLVDPLWTVLATLIGNGGPQSYCETALTNASRFYRLRIQTGATDVGYRYIAPTFNNSIGDPANSHCACASPGTPNGTSCCGNSQENANGNMLLNTGELVQRVTDLEIPGRGFNWRMERAYRSGMSYDGPLGFGWDFNYNRRLYLQPDGNVLRMDGLGRADLYLSTNGVFRAPAGFYTTLTQNGDTTFEERDRDGFRWVYSDPNSLHIASLVRMVDRYSNTMTLQYNAGNQLTNVVDTLGQSISYLYDGNGRLIEVLDYQGRALRYVQDTHGDLIMVTSPTVCGTPNGNNFDDGKTTRYTYTSGFADPRLNHKLLTLVAPNEVIRGGVARLVATYDTDPGSPGVGRLLSLNLGGGTIYYSPRNLGVAAPNDFATPVFQNDVQDRNGNSSTYQFNQLGNPVTEIHFTRGLRPDDPPGYTNRSEYNGDGEVTRRVQPEGESVEYAYDSANPDRFQQGNLLAEVRRPDARGGDEPQLTTLMTYEPNFNQVATVTDPGGNLTQHFYDPSGNRIKTIYPVTNIVEEWEYNANGQMTAHILPDNGSNHRRRDEMVYYPSGPQQWRLQRTTVDVGGFNLTTAYEYDASGNLVRLRDPRGHDTQYVVNELNQVVREISREVTDGSGIRYEKDTYYDANNNVIRVDVQNLDENGVVQTPPFLSTTYEYDSLDNLVRLSQEAAPGHNVVTEYGYDTNNNRILVRYGEATLGRQPDNVVSSVYDERNHLLSERRGGIATTHYDYDLDGNLIRVSEGLEDTGGVRITTYAYDGYNRLVMTTDPMGNRKLNFYDASGNVTNAAVDGELYDIPGSVGNVRLSETAYSYDAMNRLGRTDVAFFDAETQAPIGDGQVTTITLYTPSSQMFAMIDDNGHGTTNTYDNVNRLLSTTDAKGNTTTRIYDANNNIVTNVETELSDLGSPSQSFTNRNVYDNLDRLIASVDNLGNINRVGYDSRDNRTLTMDARGNVTHYDYDGLNRLVRTVSDMTTTGDGTGAPAGTIATQWQWDDSSRLIAQIDDNLNATRYAYDALDRRIVTRMADGTMHWVGSGTVLWDNAHSFPDLGSFTAGYDVHDNAVTRVDANSNTVWSAYDLLNRVTNRTIMPGPGVLGSTNETYRYDGASRLTLAQDDASRVARAYDSLGRVVRETNNLSAPTFPADSDQVVLSIYDGLGNETACTYPGGTQVTTTYDELDRKAMISSQNSVLARYAYIGRNRVERRCYSNGICADYTYDAAKQVSAIKHWNTNTMAVVEQRTFARDANYSKTSRADTRPAGSGVTNNYYYDSINRLVRSVSTNNSGLARDMRYQLDGVGNRCFATTNPLQTSCDYAANAVNEFTSTPTDTRSHDANGNLISITGGPSAATYAYDYRNLMIRAVPASGPFISYTYDPLGRRVQKSVGGATTRFLYDGWQELEEQDTDGATLATYVYGVYIDEVLFMKRGSTNVFYSSDDLYSVMAITDDSGNVLERCDYDDYGEPTLLSPSGFPLAGSMIGNASLFTGRRFDQETHSYYYRARSYDWQSGRYFQRDPQRSTVNAYEYVGSAPVNRVDPTGERWQWAQHSGDNGTEKWAKQELEDYTHRFLGLIMPIPGQFWSEASITATDDGIRAQGNATFYKPDSFARLIYSEIKYRANRKLLLTFDCDPVTGRITKDKNNLDSWDNLGRSAGPLTVDIEYIAKIDNTGDDLHIAEVEVKVVMNVGGTVETSVVAEVGGETGLGEKGKVAGKVQFGSKISHSGGSDRGPLGRGFTLKCKKCGG